VPVQILEDEGGFNRDAFQICQHRRRFAAVVERLGILFQGILTAMRSKIVVSIGDDLSDIAAASQKPSSYAPLEGSEVQSGTGSTHHAHGTDFLDRFYDDDRRRRIDQDLEPLQRVFFLRCRHPIDRL
jgi:hypothetical protein